MMGKRITVVVLSLFLLIGLLFSVGATPIQANTNILQQTNNPFAQADNARKDTLKRSTSKDNTETNLHVQSKETLLQEATQEKDKEEGRTFIVKFRSTASLQAIYDVIKTEEYQLIGYSANRLIVLTTSDIEAFKKKAGSLIEYVEKNQVSHVADVVPNDTCYSQQWALPAINAPAAWDITKGTPKGSNTVYVAVIDSGIDREHPDLDEADIRNGWDLIFEEPVDWDSVGHGTKVTGIIAAETNNNQGISGVCWNIAIVPFRVVYASGYIYVSDIVSAVYRAADMGCKVINISIGGGYSSSEATAIQHAIDMGCIVVASAGNESSTAYSYPASYPGVISAASINNINSTFNWSTFSNYNDKVDVCAPGEAVYTTNDNYYSPYTDYASVSGTSFSSPYVAGVAALAASVNPNIMPDQFFNLIKATSRDLGTAGYDTKYGYGLINAAEMVKAAAFDVLVNGQTLTITGYTGTGGNVVIPSSINGKTVTAIGDYAFASCDNVTGITIPATVTSIGESSLSCSALTNITVDPNNPQLSSLNGVLFNKGKTTLIQYPNGKTGSYAIPNGVVTIADFAFSGSTNLSSITIPNGVTSIGKGAFLQTGLTGIAIPSSVTSIGEMALDADGLLQINVAGTNPQFSSLDGVLFNKSRTTLLDYPNGKTGRYTVPSGVTTIGDSAFWASMGLSSVVITNGVTSIGNYAFMACHSLTKVAISKTVTSIGECAFSLCEMSSVTIPESVANIGDYAFSDCHNLIAAHFLGNAPTMGEDVFDTVAAGFKIYYITGNTEFSNPWLTYTTQSESQPVYTVAYNSQNGNSVVNITTGFGDKLTAPAVPTKFEHTFIGWYLESGGVNAWNFALDFVSENTTLYAKWKINQYPVTFNSQGGSTISSINADYNSTITAPTPPTRPGFIFGGWYKDSSCTNAWNFSTDRVLGATTLYARWIAVIPVGIICQKTDVALYGGNTGSITITASGGNSGVYQYSVNGGASWQNSGYFNKLFAKTYTAMVRDANNTSNTISATVIVGQPKFVGSYSIAKIPSKVTVGTGITISPPAPPRNYSVVSVAYTSSNSTVASVDTNGNVTFLAGGKVKLMVIQVCQTVRSGRTTTKTIKVSKTITVLQPVSSITLSTTNASIMRTKTLKLAATVLPATASNKKVRWTSSNSRVATVSSSGVVSAKGVGTAVITCTAQDGSRVAASCTITVTPIYPTGVKFSRVALTVKVGRSTTLRASVLPSNTDFKTVTWVSSNTAIATVDAKGKVIGIAPGTVTITVTTSNGLKAYCTVTIK